MDAKFCIMCGEKMSLQAIYCQNCGAKKEISEVKEIKPEVKETHLEPEVNPIDSAPSETFDFRENDTNRGKKICETCGETVEIFSLQCQDCAGQIFRHPIPITKIDNDFKATPFSSSDKNPKWRFFAWAAVLSLIIVIFVINTNRNQDFIDPFIPLSELSTQSPTAASSDVSPDTQSDNGGNNCLQLQVESPYDSADFYAFQVYITNNCSYRVSIAGNFYVKTVNGSIYERPTDAIIGFHGANICGGDSNYFNYTFNPGEQSSDSVCNSVHAGDTVVSYFIADNADGKPNLQLNGTWTLG